MAEIDDTTLARFWAKVNFFGPTPAHVPDVGNCWVWTAKRNGQGYGQFGITSRDTWLSHRLAWAVANGPIDDGVCILHCCDNPSCVRPDHLWAGTHTDNMRDRNGKGRASWRCGPRGSRAKLTESQVREIRDLVEGGCPIVTVAGRYGIARVSVRRIARRHSWRHVA